jgi:TolB-like protein
MSLFEELKRRNVFRVAIAYVILAWLMAQVAEMLLETFGAPEWVLKALLVLFLVGFPFAIFFAWAFELTPEGLKKEKDVDRSQSITPQTGHKLDRTIIAVLVLAIGYFAWDKFSADPVRDSVPALVSEESVDKVPTGSKLPTDKSIAVLPFETRSNQQDDEFFTAGIHDDLLTQLAQISSLRVISRTSVAQFKNTSKSIHEIAELLSVATILEGGVQRAGNQIRINMQLIDAATDAHLWAQTYDRELTTNNIFAIQSEIATAVTAAMRATLSPDEQARIADVPTQNMEALEEYFKGRAELDQRTLPAIESARIRFRHARELDPGFALALASEAQTILFLSDRESSYGDIPSLETIALARPLLDRAIRLAPTDPQVLAVFGLLEVSDDNLADALNYYDRSLALNPSSGEVLNWNRMALAGEGRIKESVDMAARMLKVDPMSMITLFNGIGTMARIHLENDQQVEALVQRLSDLNPGFGMFSRAMVEEVRGHIPAAVNFYYQALELDPGRSSGRSDMAALLASIGFLDEAALLSPDWATINLPFFAEDWPAAIQVSRTRYDRDPSGVNTIRLMQALVPAGDNEAAFLLTEELWAEFGTVPAQLGSTAIEMTWAAKKTGHSAQARLYREVADRWLQSLIDAEIKAFERYLLEAQLAALDQRDDDAIIAISKALDVGLRWHYSLQAPIFEKLQDNPGFQVQVSRFDDLRNADAREVRGMLCGSDSILTSWEPAAETCP